MRKPAARAYADYAAASCTDPDASAYAYAYANTDTDAHTHTDADADADAHTDANSDSTTGFAPCVAAPDHECASRDGSRAPRGRRRRVRLVVPIPLATARSAP